MSDRIFIGNTGGRMLFRISQPGYDAGNLTQPAVFSSDNDYLKVHTIIDSSLTLRTWGGSGNVYTGEFAFQELGYIPMTFNSIGSEESGIGQRVFFPNDRNPATSEMNNFWQILVGTNRIWVCMSTGTGYGATYRFRSIVFTNRLDENF